MIIKKSMNWTQRLYQFRARREKMLAETKVVDADNKIARMDSIERFFIIRAKVEIDDNAKIIHSPK